MDKRIKQIDKKIDKLKQNIEELNNEKELILMRQCVKNINEQEWIDQYAILSYKSIGGEQTKIFLQCEKMVKGVYPDIISIYTKGQSFSISSHNISISYNEPQPFLPCNKDFSLKHITKETYEQIELLVNQILQINDDLKINNI